MTVTKEMKIKALDKFCKKFCRCVDCPFDMSFFPKHCNEIEWREMPENALDVCLRKAGIELTDTMKTPDYWGNICEMQKKQTEKGLRKYGQVLEENTEMTIIERLEYLEEELIDGLMYLEHIKEMLKEKAE